MPWFHCWILRCWWFLVLPFHLCCGFSRTSIHRCKYVNGINILRRTIIEISFFCFNDISMWTTNKAFKRGKKYYQSNFRSVHMLTLLVYRYLTKLAYKCTKLVIMPFWLFLHFLQLFGRYLLHWPYFNSFTSPIDRERVEYRNKD